MNDLSIIVTLIGESEERMCKKIDEVHEDVKDTNQKITAQNGRLRDVEVRIGKRETYCKERSISINKALDEMKPSATTTKIFNMLGKHPRITGFLIFAILFTSQTIVLLAVEHEWLDKLFKAFTK